MEKSFPEDSIYSEIKTLLDKMGYLTVEFKYQKLKASQAVNIVICRKDGSNIGTEDCSLVSKAVYPRFEMLDENRTVHLEVSSPGLSRLIKNASEFEIFAGKVVMLYLEGQDDWISGKITETDDEKLVIEKNGVSSSHFFKDIIKAKLDYSQEVV
jgi:ribosome maturation factor RimP